MYLPAKTFSRYESRQHRLFLSVRVCILHHQPRSAWNRHHLPRFISRILVGSTVSSMSAITRVQAHRTQQPQCSHRLCRVASAAAAEGRRRRRHAAARALPGQRLLGTAGEFHSEIFSADPDSRRAVATGGSSALFTGRRRCRQRAPSGPSPPRTRRFAFVYGKSLLARGWRAGVCTAGVFMYALWRR